MMNGNNPLVSIVTPCYNGEPYLDRFFQSVMDQTWPCLELIFVNDGSSDDTEGKVRCWSEKLEGRGIGLRYLYQENAGQAAALNRGLKEARGQFLVWPDSDDELTADSIEKKVRFLQEQPGCDFCVSAVECREENKAPWVFRRKKYRSREEAVRLLIFDKVMLPGSFMIRMDFLDRILPGREIYTGRGGQNPQILLPAFWYGKAGYLEDVLYIYYVRADSHSHSQAGSLKTIRQLQNYENICTETLRRIPDPGAHEIIPDIHRCYARQRFGTAVDTMNAELIGRYYRELAEADKTTFHEKMLALKYTNPVCRAVLGIRSKEAAEE
jgi:glycosyltransferase involved in cell wall biosynthesis